MTANRPRTVGALRSLRLCYYLSVILGSLFGVSACKSHGSRPIAGDADSACATGRADCTPEELCLPSLANCDCYIPPPLATPSGCVWAQSTDAVLWGTLTAVRKLRSPTSDYGPGGTELTLIYDCELVSHFGLELTVQVERLLAGNVPNPVTVRIGAMQLALFGSPQLRCGQTVGLGLHYVAQYDVWSVMGEPMFNIQRGQDGSSSVKFQPVPTQCCVAPPPPDLEGLTLEELAARLGLCGSDTLSVATQRRDQVVANWGSQPWNFMAAAGCLDSLKTSSEIQPGVCRMDAQCAAGELCANNWCERQ